MNLRHLIDAVRAHWHGLRCKKDDLAIIVDGCQDDLGRVVQCLEFVPRRPGLHHRNLWRIDQSVQWIHRFGGAPVSVPYIPDACLRLLRNSDGEDEILRIAGKPAGEPVKPVAPAPQTVEG